MGATADQPVAVREVVRRLIAAERYPCLGNADWREAEILEQEALALAPTAIASPDDPPEFAAWLATLSGPDGGQARGHRGQSLGQALHRGPGAGQAVRQEAGGALHVRHQWPSHLRRGHGHRGGGPCFASITGISQLPFAAEAVFAIGPYGIRIDRETLKAIDAGHQHRPVIRKPNGALVPAYTFLHDDFRPISGIWAADIDGSAAIGQPQPMAIVHNPNAQVPVPMRLLPAHEEIVAAPSGSDHYSVTRQPGRLQPS